MKRIPYSTQDEWHAIRAKHIGGSEVAALFNAFEKPDGTIAYYSLFEDVPEGLELIGCVSPYCSGVRLWHEKKGTIERKQVDTDPMKAGRHFESGIARWTQEDNPEWDIRKVKDYIGHATIDGMGASLDYEIWNHPSGHTAMDCKLTGQHICRSKWQEGGAVPMHIELQLQHQMACTGFQHGLVAVCAGLQAPRAVDVPRDEDVIKMCEDAVIACWEAIEAGKEPDIKYDKTVAQDLYHTSDKEVVLDCSDSSLASNLELQMLVDADEIHKNLLRGHQSGHKATTNEILAIVKNADKVLLPDGRVLWAKTITVKRKAATASTSTRRRLTLKEAT